MENVVYSVWKQILLYIFFTVNHLLLRWTVLVNNRYWKVIIVSYSFVNFCSISLSPYPMCGPANFHLVPLPARSSAACLNQGVTVNYDILSRDRWKLETSPFSCRTPPRPLEDIEVREKDCAEYVWVRDYKQPKKLRKFPMQPFKTVLRSFIFFSTNMVIWVNRKPRNSSQAVKKFNSFGSGTLPRNMVNFELFKASKQMCFFVLSWAWDEEKSSEFPVESNFRPSDLQIPLSDALPLTPPYLTVTSSGGSRCTTCVQPVARRI